MNQQHIDSRLNESQLEENFGQHSSEEDSIKPRIYEEDQSSLDNKFKLNAYQVEGRLECKL